MHTKNQGCVRKSGLIGESDTVLCEVRKKCSQNGRTVLREKNFSHKTARAILSQNGPSLFLSQNGLTKRYLSLTKRYPTPANPYSQLREVQKSTATLNAVNMESLSKRNFELAKSKNERTAQVEIAVYTRLLVFRVRR